MKNAIAIFCAACLARAALAVTMASQPWTTNRIAEAEARLSAQIVAATNAIPQAELPEYWPLYAVTNRDGTPVSSSNFDGLNIDGIGATASDAWQMATDALGGLSGVAQSATNYTDAVALEFERGQRTAKNADFASNSITASEATFLLNDSGDQSYNATHLITESTNAALAVAGAKISTNNAAFVAAVLAVPLTGADAGDLAEIAEYGGYGTVGAAILALIAGLAALKRRVTSAETALAQKASLTDLPYRLVEPGKWEFSGSGYDPSKEYSVNEDDYESAFVYNLFVDGEWADDNSSLSQGALTVNFGSAGITATRASLPGHLLDRAGNRMAVTGDTTLTLPAAVPGHLRDFLVRLEISGSTVPTITFAAPTGEAITYETDGDEFPVPDEAGDWLYSFTESCVAHKFAVSLKKVQTVAQGGS